MDLSLDLSVRGERSVVLYRALLEAIREGRLRSGDRLPASRTLAADLGLGRNTVTTVYERLVAEGHLEARTGSGTYVADVVPLPRRRPARAALRPRAGWAWTPRPVSGDSPPPAHDFRAGIPDGSLFPYDTWRRLVSARTRSATVPGTYAGPTGQPALRAAVARHLAYARGVQAEPDDIVTTHGTQHALDLVARVLLRPGDTVAVEDPGYPSARDLFAAHGCRVVPVRVDEEGLVVDELPERCRLVFVTPSHQFPLGPPLSLARRHALLDHARRHDLAVVEDDYDSEFRFVERPLDPLHRLDRDGRVIYVGTFSKSLLPALRLGYLVAPPGLLDALAAARQLSDGFGRPEAELALADFIDDGLMARHVRRATRVYAERRDLVATAAADLGLRLLPSAAGLHLTGVWDEGVSPADVEALLRAAAAEGVVAESLAGYCSLGRPAGVVLGYGAAATASIRPGMRRLARLRARAAGR
ncbi:PLP-dependent aminotransferase family protein [Nocardioides sp. SYSU D00038]|uniref:MocR-like pyridoxine biosynthesis transcription factor PdxR n=1 Tax=Nocardioides sp. SYSU D00038 TaxID=2812554 RepID=UPI00196867E0|nr:PLP-dependent aminotransferase family protein [Nocardioides sp. SYSU D00038]